MVKNILILLYMSIFVIFSSFAREVGFTQEDRERLIRLETTMQVFMEQTNKRFEDINKRFEELREDMNKRFELVDKRFEDINKRFEDINKRFEDINRRFEQLYTFLWIITGIFTTIMIATIGFAYWDRRTIIKKAKEETIEQLEREGKLRNLIEALRELAKKDPELARVLKQFNLL